MNRILVPAAALGALLALGACGRGGDKDALTSEENRQLDNASQMLDASPDNLVPAGNVAVGNGEETSMDAVAEEDEEAGNDADSANAQ